MKKTMLMASLAVALVSFAGVGFAQTCASPLPITSAAGPNGVVSGDTCTAANTLPTYGGTGSPQNEIVYSFVANAANGSISIAQNGGFAGTTAGVFLLPACTASTDPINFGATGVPMTILPASLTNGQTYYVVVTADPGGPNGGCGQFTATVTGVLPVALQKFSVE